jgi:imidazolonepropionase
MTTSATPRTAVDTLVVNIHELATIAGANGRARRGADLADAGLVANGAVAIKDGLITAVGPASELKHHVVTDNATRVIDATGCLVTPGLIDPHTHLVFGGTRENEFVMRLQGATYAEIMAAGGGIHASMRATREASLESLVESGRARLRRMLANGTTTLEAKSGYGMDLDTELKQLEAIAQLASEGPQEILATYMGAHAVPAGTEPDAYVDYVVATVLPEVAQRGLAAFCDVFCETGVFTPEESAEILEAGKRAGLKPRIHADELGASGGSQVAAQVGARSADHLVHVPADGIAAMSTTGVIATLLPCAAFYLKLGRFAPARDLIAAGVPVALATDINPGGGFSPSMPFAMTLACFGMRMTFEEALVGATITAAASIDRDDRVGSLEPGKQLDAVLVHGPAINLLRVGAASIAGVFKRGKGIDTHGPH